MNREIWLPLDESFQREKREKVSLRMMDKANNNLSFIFT